MLRGDWLRTARCLRDRRERPRGARARHPGDRARDARLLRLARGREARVGRPHRAGRHGRSTGSRCTSCTRSSRASCRAPVGRRHRPLQVERHRALGRGDRARDRAARARARCRHDRGWLDGLRVEGRLDAIYAIGGGPGANRIGGTAAEDEAHRLAGGWMREAGLEVEVDPDGNLVGRLPGTSLELPEVWTGSHLDTRPAGRALRRPARRPRRSSRQSRGSGDGTDAGRCRLPRRGARLRRQPRRVARRRRSPAPLSSSTIEQGPVPRARRPRSASSRRSSATQRASSSSTGALATPARRRWTHATTRSSRRPSSSCDP